VRAPRAHDDVAADSVRDRGLDEVLRAAEVDGQLAGRPTAGPSARREDDGVGPRDGVVDLDVLDVEDDRLGADRLPVRRLLGLADDPPRAVTAAREDLLQAHRDLAVPSDDRDVHPADDTGPPHFWGLERPISSTRRRPVNIGTWRQPTSA